MEVGASRDPEIRVEVVRRRLAADADPVGFAARWADADAEIAGQVAAARRRLPGVRLPDAALRQIAEVCAAFDVDGMRADIVTARTALAHAAWHGRDRVTIDDVRVAARLALPHRRRRDPFDTPGLDEKRLDEALQRAQDAHPDDPDDAGPDDSGPDGGGPQGGGPAGGGGPNGGGPHEGGPSGGGPQGGDGVDHCEPGSTEHSAARSGAGPDGRTDGPDGTDGWPQRQPGDRGDDDGWPQHQQGGDGRNSRPRGGRQSATGADDPTGGGESQPVAVPKGGLKARVLTAPGLGDGVPGRRSRARTGRGRTTGARVPAGRVGALHLPATIRAAAPHQAARGRVTGPLRLRRDDLREAVREGREGNLVLFVVDASGSMGARQRMTTVKDAVLALLTDAYQRRDKVAVIAFRGGGARTLLPATSSVLAASTRLAELPTGGRTPLAEGLLAAADLLRVERLRDPKRRPLVLIVTDGRATAGTRPLDRAAAAAAVLAATGAPCVVVDCESGPVRLHLAARLATQLRAPEPHWKPSPTPAIMHFLSRHNGPNTRMTNRNRKIAGETGAGVPAGRGRADAAGTTEFGAR